MTDKTERVCPECGSTAISVDVSCVWSSDHQEWVIDGDPDEHGGIINCQDCPDGNSKHLAHPVIPQVANRVLLADVTGYDPEIDESGFGPAPQPDCVPLLDRPIEGKLKDRYAL